jgi:hypothetical protein
LSVNDKKTPAPQRAGTDVQEMSEWTELGARLALAGPEKFDEMLEALRKIVDVQETISGYDWQLLFGSRPSKRYRA